MQVKPEVKQMLQDVLRESIDTTRERNWQEFARHLKTLNEDEHAIRINLVLDGVLSPAGEWCEDFLRFGLFTVVKFFESDHWGYLLTEKKQILVSDLGANFLNKYCASINN